MLGPYADHGRHACFVTRRWAGPDTARLPPPRPTLFGLICRHRVLLSWPWPVSVGDIVAAVCNAANRLGQSWFVRWLGEWLLGVFRPLATVRDVGYHIMDLGRSGANCYRGNSLEVAFDAAAGDHVDFVNDDLFPLFEHMAARGVVVGGYVSLRFTRRSRATLGMQRWDPTCHIEIALLQGVRGNTPILQALEAAAVARGGAVHWGQLNMLTAGSVRQAFPALPGWQLEIAEIAAAAKPSTTPSARNATWSQRSARPRPAASGRRLLPQDSVF